MFHPFRTSFYKNSQRQKFLILTGILFHTITPENDRLPLKRLHFAYGTNRFLFVTDPKLEAVLLSLISRIIKISFNRQEPNCFVF